MDRISVVMLHPTVIINAQSISKWRAMRWYDYFIRRSKNKSLELHSLTSSADCKTGMSSNGKSDRSHKRRTSSISRCMVVAIACLHLVGFLTIRSVFEALLSSTQQDPRRSRAMSEVLEISADSDSRPPGELFSAIYFDQTLQRTPVAKIQDFSSYIIAAKSMQSSSLFSLNNCS